MKLESYQEIKAYYEGIKDGIRMYAWWKDGMQYVGTTGRTLLEAHAEVVYKENEIMQAFSEGRTVYTH